MAATNGPSAKRRKLAQPTSAAAPTEATKDANKTDESSKQSTSTEGSPREHLENLVSHTNLVISGPELHILSNLMELEKKPQMASKSLEAAIISMEWMREMTTVQELRLCLEEIRNRKKKDPPKVSAVPHTKSREHQNSHARSTMATAAKKPNSAAEIIYECDYEGCKNVLGFLNKSELPGDLTVGQLRDLLRANIHTKSAQHSKTSEITNYHSGLSSTDTPLSASAATAEAPEVLTSQSLAPPILPTSSQNAVKTRQATVTSKKADTAAPNRKRTLAQTERAEEEKTVTPGLRKKIPAKSRRVPEQESDSDEESFRTPNLSVNVKGKTAL
ncbi:hypothetical protein BU23DRAFT_568641 [Bimuria novae-zelandiae CBS 107.79]|uniref:Uncharacterized protein n=1 Tax=Bimuria novae-zelandiae CBS 107.79 TaxID=1447943 RepID=A0A6A5V9X6_9PLEO|nr:hypothetical protein BU23DRAFT_568641 [Bimuria novae-zelandiae CBS 107.79]